MALQIIRLEIERENSQAVIALRGQYEGQPRLCRLRLKAESTSDTAELVRQFVQRAQQAFNAGQGLVVRVPPEPQGDDLD